MPRKKFQRDFFLEKVGKGNQATNAKKDAFNARKVWAGLYPGKQATNSRNDIFDTQTQKVRAGFHPGKQATNSRKVTFTAGRVPTGFRSGKQATNSKKALFGTQRVWAGLYPIYGGAIWAFIRVILLYAGAGLSHEACDGFAVIQGEIPTHFLPGFVARDSDTRSDAISDTKYEMLFRYRIRCSDHCGEIFECHDTRAESDNTMLPI